MKSFKKSIYLDMATGRIDQASKFSEKPHENPERFHFIGYHNSFSSLTAEFINRNMQIRVKGSGYNYLVDIPKSARAMRRNVIKIQHKAEQERKIANLPENIRAKAQKAINVVAEKPWTADERYWANCYHGCGVYRLAIRDGKITATLYGGYHGSCPANISMKNWLPVIQQELEKHGTVVKADGSGTQFFLREQPDETLIETKVYDVPAPHGDGNKGFVHQNIQIK